MLCNPCTKEERPRLTKRETMKKLGDMCLECIGQNLKVMPNIGKNLATVHKEILLERMGYHNLYTHDMLPYVTYNLFSDTLKNLTFYKCDVVTDEFLKILSKCGLTLNSLCIHKCHHVSDAGILNITEGQKELLTLKLQKLTQLTCRGLAVIGSNKLTHLSLRGCSNLKNEGVKQVIRSNENIQDLNISHCLKLDDSVVPVIAACLPDLESLDADNIRDLSDASLSLLAENCTNLRRINIHGTSKINEEGLGKLFRICKKLQCLNLTYCSAIAEPPGSNVLYMLPSSISHLSLCGIPITDERLLVESISRLNRLKAVNLCGVTAFNDNTIEEIMENLGEHLEELNLGGSIMSQLTDEGLKAIPKYCKTLKRLNLSLLRSITAEPLLKLFEDQEKASQLEVLHLGCTKVNYNVLFTMVSNCKALEELDLSDLKIVDDLLLYALAENCPYLTSFGIKGCTKVTDSGVKAIAYSCPLTIIRLSGINNLTDSTVFALANTCNYLQEVYVNGCSLMTAWALRYLKDCCIQRVHVDHIVPNASQDQIMAKNLDTGEFCLV